MGDLVFGEKIVIKDDGTVVIGGVEVPPVQESISGIEILQYTLNMKNDQYIDLPSNSMGWIEVLTEDGAEYGIFMYRKDGTVIKRETSINVDNMDQADTFCVYNNGSNQVRIKNRLGYTSFTAIKIRYSKYEKVSL